MKHKKSFVFSLILIGMITLFFGKIVSAEICEAPSGYNCWYVSPSGSDLSIGSFEEPFETVQKAIDEMDGGDIIYLMSGTYKDRYIMIPNTKDGTCSDVDCTEGSWSTLKSYPGEWGILDGKNKSCPKGGVIGSSRGTDNTLNTYIRYWKFENIEVTGGGCDENAGAASGIHLNRGPFIIRGCYIHDNIAFSMGATYCGANPAGLRGTVWKNSLVEFNYFNDNGCDLENEQHSIGGIQIFSDYKHAAEYWETAPYDIDRALTNNTIRYNLFDNKNKRASAGIHNKGKQYLTPKTNVDWTYEDYGDKIHHNIFLNFKTAIANQQDFQQIYNNIIDIPEEYNDYGIGIRVHDPGDGGNNIGITAYNNLIIRGKVVQNFGTYDYVPNPYFYLYNNILDKVPSNYDGLSAISLGYAWMPRGFNYDPSKTDLSNNYLYRGESNEIKVTRNDGECYNYLTISEYEQCYGETNYNKASSEGSDNLYIGNSGASQYITRPSHVIEGSLNVGNAGIRGNHPYLDGVTIPSYIGAVNPNDNDWVEGVLGLANINYLMALEGTPEWIEGADSNENPQDPEPYCGDGICESSYGETCSNCPQDCLNSGQVCCSGVAYTGNCCGDSDCSTGYECISHICEEIQAVDGTTRIILGNTPEADYNLIEDSYINVNTESPEQETTLNTYTWPVNEIANAILLKMDLSSISSNIDSSNIESAKLYLYQTSSGGDSGYDLSVHRIINHNPLISEANGYTYDGVNEWTANNHRSDGVPLAQGDISTAYDAKTLDLNNGYKEFDITSLVKYWLQNPGENYGLLINSDPVATSDSYRFFASSENTNSGIRPYVVIDYSSSGGIIDFSEISSYLQRWLNGEINLNELLSVINEWRGLN